jgi:ATP-dependent RNA circularization protein (DNA/RNA ligase family)
MSIEIIKFVRTPHLEGSRLQSGDEDLSQVRVSELFGKRVIIEEKVDGANAGISFSHDGSLLLQSRGHYLTGGPREKHWDLFKQWAAVHEATLLNIIGDRYIIYGEWLFAKHTVFYDLLPHYFLAFDVFDKETNTFISTQRRLEQPCHTWRRKTASTSSIATR